MSAPFRQSAFAGPWSLRALLFALLALCLWLALRIVLIVLDAAAPAGAGDAAGMAPVTVTVPQASLAQWHLFGNALAPSDPRQAAAVPDSALDLTLVGVLAHADPDAGIALIADGNGQQAAYRTGAGLPGGARLKSVYPGHVLIIGNGREEQLRLPRESANTAVAGASPDSAPAVGPGMAQAPVAVAGLETVDWGAVQQKMQFDPAELARQVKVLPVIENGSMVGVRLGGAGSPMLARLGLQPDDIVTAVNGVSVRDPGRAQQVIAAVRDAERVAVTIRRGGREQTLNVDLK